MSLQPDGAAALHKYRYCCREKRDVSCVVLYSSSTQLYSCTAGELAHDAEALVFIRYYGYRDEGMLKYVALN